MNARLFAALFVIAFAGCPAPLQPEPLEKAPRVTVFAASRTLVNKGEQVTLSWETENATSVRLEETSLGAVSGVDGTSGTVEVAVEGNSLFVLTARNARGATHRAVVAVSVREAEGDVLLTAMPTEVNVGEPLTLAWSAPNATELTLTADPGGAVDVGGQLASGTVTVTAAQTTTYTLTAGTRTATVTVTVRPTLLSFTSSTDAVEPTDAGASVTLSWSTANTTRVQLLAGARGALVNTTDAALMADGGFTDVLPAPIDSSRIYRYELQLEGANAQTVSKVISLPVRGNPLISTLSAPQYARFGQPFTVSWTTTGADSVSLFQGGVEVHRSPNAATAAAGSVSMVAATGNMIIELVARGARAGESRDSVEVQVVSAPSLTLATEPAVITRATPFQLTWSGQSVRNLRVFDGEGRPIFAATGTSDTGTVPLDLLLGHAQRYVAIADNALGESVTATLLVEPTDPFTFTNSLTGSAAEGQRVELSWPGGETIYGFPHDTIITRTGSTGFDDISGTGTLLVFSSVGSTRDDETAPIVTDFRMPFWGREVGDVITVSSNGYLTFGVANRLNYGELPLPSAKMDPNSVVLYWDDLRMAAAQAYWQVKSVGGERVLIVQWSNLGNATTVGNTFQAKLFESGRIDLEYQAVTITGGQGGIQGPRGNEGLVLPVAPATGLGATFLAPKQSPLTFAARSRAPYRGFLKNGTRWVPVQTTVDVVHAEDLQLGEVQIESAVGSDGRWLEFYNARSTTISLDGWTLTRPDGGVSPLTGQLPPSGVRVFGTSTDPALNDDAGVDVQLTDFDVSGNAGRFDFGAGNATLGSWAWVNPTTGFAQVSDYGPYKFTGDVTASLARPHTCVPASTYGGQTPPQRGSPGRDASCGFGYRWEKIPVGYFDISTTGTKHVANTTTATILNIDLSAAPFPFFGTSRNAIRISADGYLTFDLTSANDLFSNNYPSTGAPNSVLAIFADDLGGRETDSGVFSKRVAANEDPFAAAPHWVFQWHRWAHLAGDDLNFQVKLFDDGTIEYHFAKMQSGASATPYGSGLSSNTWLENPGGTQALVINANSVTPGISPFTAYRFSTR